MHSRDDVDETAPVGRHLPDPLSPPLQRRSRESRSVRVSIITPCYNSARFIGKTIASVMTQTWTDWEQIVVDDGSIDASASVTATWAAQDPRLRLISKTNGGVASARNAGFRESDPGAAYLLFLDADDCLEPTMLTTMVDELDANPETGLVYCGHTYIDAEDRTIDVDPRSMGWSPRYVSRGLGVAELPPEVAETPFMSVFSLATIIPSLCLMRRSVYEQTPGWDETFGQHYEDTNLILHMAVRAGVRYLNRPLVRHRRYPEQSTANLSRYGLQERKLYSQWRDRADLTPQQQTVVRAAFRFRERRLLPYQGTRAGLRNLRQGRFGPAVRFTIGAFRRYFGSLLERP